MCGPQHATICKKMKYEKKEEGEQMNISIFFFGWSNSTSDLEQWGLGCLSHQCLF